jgi:hypothetical protein
MQEGHPITFESQKLNKIESLKSTYDKEMFDIIHALPKWCKHLLGIMFLRHTNHNSIQYIL